MDPVPRGPLELEDLGGQRDLLVGPEIWDPKVSLAWRVSLVPPDPLDLPDLLARVFKWRRPP